jgi:hypothetical protein
LRIHFFLSNGAWRSLVAHLLWEQGVEGSNPFAPTRFSNPFFLILITTGRTFRDQEALPHMEKQTSIREGRLKRARTSGQSVSFLLSILLALVFSGGCSTSPQGEGQEGIREAARMTGTDLIRGLAHCEPRNPYPAVEVGEVGGNFHRPPGFGGMASRRRFEDREDARRAMILFREFLVDRLVNSRSVQYVTASEVKRRALSEERLYQMQHASSSTVHAPGHLIGADFGVVARFSREKGRVISAHLEALDFSNNRVCWSRVQQIHY